MSATEICGINLPTSVSSKLANTGFSFYNGSIGYPTKIKYQRYGTNCLPQERLPENFHEYEVVILDLTHAPVIPYNPASHTRENHKQTEAYYLFCEHPQTIFDPRPFSLKRLEKILSEMTTKHSLIIVFCSAEDKLPYRTDRTSDIFERSTYDFFSVPYHENKAGKRTSVASGEGELLNYLRRFNEEFSYEITFDLPDRYDPEKQKIVPDPNYTPLIHSADGKTIGFMQKVNDSGIFFFPQVRSKAEFLGGFLSDITPIYFPDVFPEIIKDQWINEAQYSMDVENELVLEKAEIERRFQEELKQNANELIRVQNEFRFVKNLLIATDQILVNSVIDFLKWLGFQNVLDGDVNNTEGKKEEDINIETNDGLIIIEVKGLGGTSKDADCSQIGKVRRRREKARNKLDVHAHYIVNHQRHKPAHNRKNPPFTPEQIADAEDDQRGLLSTWQLFNVFNAINAGILTKTDVRKAFFTSGLVSFLPENIQLLGQPKELFQKGKIIILDLDGAVALKVGEILIWEEDQRFFSTTIESLRVYQEDVSSASHGEVGIALSVPVKKTTILRGSKSIQ